MLPGCGEISFIAPKMLPHRPPKSDLRQYSMDVKVGSKIRLLFKTHWKSLVLKRTTHHSVLHIIRLLIFLPKDAFGIGANQKSGEALSPNATTEPHWSMSPGHFPHKADDSSAVVAEFYLYLWCVDVEHNAQYGGILKFHFPCNLIRSGAPGSQHWYRFFYRWIAHSCD